VYRVRVGNMSRDEAVSMCERLKASGGSCFVARN
jgi:SPOR domain